MEKIQLIYLLFYLVYCLGSLDLVKKFLDN